VPYALARSSYHRVTKGQQGQRPLLWVHPGDQLGGGLKNGTFYISSNATAQNIKMIVKTTAKGRKGTANLLLTCEGRFAKICRVERVMRPYLEALGMKMAGLYDGRMTILSGSGRIRTSGEQL
jgi:hypothetical protein